jgi:hypothetical protein
MGLCRRRDNCCRGGHLCHTSAVRFVTASSLRTRLLVAALASAVAVGLVATGRVTAATGASRPCSTYPRPGQTASPGSKIPLEITRVYSLFRENGKAPTLSKSVLAQLPASGIITAGIHYLGRTGDGYKLYAVPATHYLPYELAPLRCFSSDNQRVETELRPALAKDYRHAAVCIAQVGTSVFSASPIENCGAPESIGNAMLSASGTPLIGLAPNSVRAVQATYLADPPQVTYVHHNFYEIKDRSMSSPPCAVNWLDPSGNSAQLFEGCDYETAELPEYKQYQAYVRSELPVVRSDVQTLVSAIASGGLRQAEADWLTAHQAWLALGQDDKQYGAFGNLGNEIDGISAGLVGGEASPEFSGFHKIELDLWTKDDLAAAATDTATLEQLLSQLIAVPPTSDLPNTTQGVANWLLRPHEILEDAERDTLTGVDEYGSGTAAASTIADVAAVREDLGLLSPTLEPLAPRFMKTIGAQLSAIDTAADATRVDGQWVGIAEMSLIARENLDAAVDTAVETLSPVPDLLTSTGKAAPPS